PEKLSPEFHRNRLQELYRHCPDGLILLRGELSWYRKREFRTFDSTYADFNFKQEKNLYYLTGIEVPDSFVLIDPKRREVRVYSVWKGERELQELQKIKQPEEIRLLRRANEIAVQGVVEGIKAIRPGLYDHDIAAVMEYVFVRQGSVAPTFAFNIMSGPNSFLNLLSLWSDYYHLDR